MKWFLRRCYGACLTVLGAVTGTPTQAKQAAAVDLARPDTDPSTNRTGLMPKTVGLAAAAAFVGCVVLANYLTAQFHFVPVGFGQMAVAGTFAAGLALGLRDIIQDTLGRLGSVAAILAGAGLSLAVAPPALAFASGLAFLVSELADLAVYTPLRRRGRFGGKRWAAAVAASNLVGAIVDTAIFLAVAFGASAVLPGMAGQLIGKGWATLAVLAVGVAVAGVRRTSPKVVTA